MRVRVSLGRAGVQVNNERKVPMSELLNRAEVVELLNARGYRVSIHFFVRCCARLGKNDGPPVADTVGKARAFLYRRDDVLRWAAKRLVFVTQHARRGEGRTKSSRRPREREGLRPAA
jgi:hypothetical protein